MTTYIEQYALLENQQLFEKAHQAIVKAAIDIASELDTTEGHDARVAYATRVLSDPASHTRSFLPGIVADSTIDELATDITLYNRVSAIWNAYAGA